MTSRDGHGPLEVKITGTLCIKRRDTGPSLARWQDDGLKSLQSIRTRAYVIGDRDGGAGGYSNGCRSRDDDDHARFPGYRDGFDAIKRLRFSRRPHPVRGDDRPARLCVRDNVCGNCTIDFPNVTD